VLLPKQSFSENKYAHISEDFGYQATAMMCIKHLNQHFSTLSSDNVNKDGGQSTAQP